MHIQEILDYVLHFLIWPPSALIQSYVSPVRVYLCFSFLVPLFLLSCCFGLKKVLQWLCLWISAFLFYDLDTYVI